jgi:hypothetical protein
MSGLGRWALASVLVEPRAETVRVGWGGAWHGLGGMEGAARSTNPDEASTATK